MLYLKCTDFNDVFYQVNRYLLFHPDKMEFMDRDKGCITDLVLECSSTNIDMDISQFGYTTHKWNHLVNHYLSLEAIEDFKDKISKSTCLSNLFDFELSGKKDPCLYSMVVSRKNQRKPWSDVSLVYRNCELNRKFLVDLILIHKLLNDVFDIHPDKITFFMSTAYIESRFINGYLDLFDVDYEDVDTNYPFTKRMKDTRDIYFRSDSEICETYRSCKLSQERFFGKIDLPKISLEDLDIMEVIK